MGRGGEIFVLNMGTPIKVDDLARNLIVRLEKMYEELFRPEDVRRDTGNDDIFVAVPEESDMAILKEQMSGLRLLAELPEPAPIIDEIRKLIPSYTGHPKGANKRGDKVTQNLIQ